jgi:ABC-2 type transport system permease protein
MNWNLALKTLNDRWKSTLFYGIGLAAYTLMITAIYPSFKNMPNVDEFLENYPEELLRFFGASEFDFTNFNSYINIEFLGLMLVIIVGVYVFAFARSVTAGEMKDGTLELLVTQPIERWEIVASKSAVMLAGIVALMVTVVLSIFAFGSMFGVGVSYSGFASFLPVAIALFLCIGCYAILLEVIMPRGGTMAAVGLTIGFYLINFIGRSVSSVSAIRYFSIFNYYDPSKVLAEGTVPWLDVLVLVGVGLACVAAGAYIFQHRDLNLS